MGKEMYFITRNTDSVQCTIEPQATDHNLENIKRLRGLKAKTKSSTIAYKLYHEKYCLVNLKPS